MKIIMSVTNCFRNLFSVLKKFFEKMESKDNTYTKTRNPDTDSAMCIPPRSQALWCDAHSEVQLHTVESKSKSLLVSVCF